MKNKFKAGDLVFELDFHAGIKLEVLKRRPNLDGDANELSTRYGHNYSQCGKAYPSFKVPHLLRATPENHKALVTLYGEDAVPKLPLSPQEITLKLLENQKYQLCRVSNHSTDWKHNKNLKAIVHIGVFGEFLDSNGEGWTYGIPIDNNGNEITEIEE